MPMPIMMPYGGGSGGYRRGGYRKYKMPWYQRKKYKRGQKAYKTLGAARRWLKDEKAKDIAAGQPPWGVADPNSRSWNMFGKDYASANEAEKIRRRLYSYRGPGDYRSFRKYIPRGLGAIAGGVSGFMGGGLEGALSGARSGWGTGGNVSRFLGWGDYGPVEHNQIMDGGPPNDQMQIGVNNSDLTGDVFISHSEFVQNIYANVASAPANSAFQIVTFSINVGLNSTFPFLSQLAQNYVLYQLEGLVFQYKPTSGEYGNNNSNSIGKVIMATNYDPTDLTPFVNSVQMENYDYANSCKPSCGMVHGVETKPQSAVNNMLYVRTGASPKSEIFTDIGTFSVATEGIPFGGTGAQTGLLGELWVAYKVRLSRANLYGSLLGQNILCYAANWVPLTTALYDGSTLDVHSAGTLDITVANSSNKEVIITFPVNISLGCFRINALLAQTTGTADIIFNSFTNPSNLTFYAPQIQLPSSSNSILRTPDVTSGAGSNQKDLGAFVYVVVQAPGNLQASCRLSMTGPVEASTTKLYLTVEQACYPMSQSLD